MPSEARQSLIAALGAAGQAYQRSTDALDDVVARRLRVNRTDLRCLDWLTDGPTTVGHLTKAIGLSSAATTTMLDRLERKDLVRRVRDRHDRRKVVVELTDRAQHRIAELYGPMVTEGNALLERYSDDEIALLRDFLRRARELTDAYRDRLVGEE